jgi:BioD-like phosphotransacetylase family protein
MASLFVVSTETFTGKTAVAAGLMRELRRDGYTVGYMKTVSATPRVTGTRLVDADAHFIRQTFDLPAPLDQIVAVNLTASVAEDALRGERNLVDDVVRAFEALRSEVDVLMVEGGGDLGEGALLGLSAPELIERLDVPAIAVTRYVGRLTGDELLLTRRVLGDHLIGAVVNAVPVQEQDVFKGQVVPRLESRGVEVLAVLPRQRLLMAATVQELADGINGEVLTGAEHMDALVENLTVGAMGVDNALAHFRRKANKAVITGGDRSDIQLAALETSTRCLILTGNLRPSPLIVAQAEEQGVPIIISQQSTLETVETINQFFGRTRFHQEAKLEQFYEIFDTHFEFDKLYSVLGLSR